MSSSPSGTDVQVISQQQITDYLKLLVEYGGVWKVSDDYTILTPDGNPVLLDLGSNKQLPMKIFNPHMTTSAQCIYLNPFKESLAPSPERSWFWVSRSMILGFLCQEMLKALVTKLLTKTEQELDVSDLDLAKAVVDNVDEKTLDALNCLKPSDYATIFYHKKTKTAQLQCPVLQTEHQESFKSKLRKKDWAVVTTFMETVLRTDKPEELYTYTASTIISMLEGEAILNVLTKITEAIAPYVQTLLGRELPVDAMISHLELLPKYHKLVAWHQPSTKSDAKVLASALPWESRAGESMAMPGSNGNVLSNAVVAGSNGATSSIRGAMIAATPTTPIQSAVMPPVLIQATPVVPGFGMSTAVMPGSAVPFGGMMTPPFNSGMPVAGFGIPAAPFGQARQTVYGNLRF